jgi:branched-chain amino acid transport system permease protein
VLSGRIGRALLATKDAEVSAESSGVNIVAYKTFAFALGSACTSLAGALYAYTVGLISPDAFSMFMSINLIAACVVGGVTYLSGAVIGAVLLQYVPTLAGEIHQSLSGFAFGIVLIVFMLLMPRGVVGLAADFLRRRAQRQPMAMEARTT